MKRGKFLKAVVGLPLVLSQLSFKEKPKQTRRVWKPEDITAGLYITRNYDADVRKNAGLVCSVTFQVGYNLAMGRRSFEWRSAASGQKYVVADRIHDPKCQYTLNSVADGFSHGDCLAKKWGEHQPFMAYTKEALCDELNNDKWGYYPTTKDEMHVIIDYMSKNFLNG